MPNKNWPVILFLVLGSVLRLLWPEDMEWKGDEIWMWEKAMDAVKSGQWPGVGMMSSIGVENPGMSVWVFILIGFLCSTPVHMVQGVIWLNILSLWGAYFFFQRAVPLQNRGPWLWGVALAAVTPLSIVFSRKIWAQCVLTPFCLLFLIGHWYRHRRSGALLWGLAGALIGQVHMSGFFLAGAFLFWTLWKEIREKTWRSLPWGYWIAGSSIGALGLLPWIGRVHPAGRTPLGMLKELLTFRFFSQWWGAAFGVNLKYSLHDSFWSDFIKEPFLAGNPTYLVAAAHLFLLACAVFLIGRWLVRKPVPPSSPELKFYAGAALIGAGTLMTLAGIRVYAHYLIVFFPLIHIWLADKFYSKRALLVSILVAQALVSITFMRYIHANGGVPTGEYGTAYRLQRYPVSTN